MFKPALCLLIVLAFAAATFAAAAEDVDIETAPPIYPTAGEDLPAVPGNGAAAGEGDVSAAPEGDFGPAAPICPTCPDHPAALIVHDEDYEAAGIPVWICPDCGRYYYKDAWHEVAAFHADKASLTPSEDVAPTKCPKCGGKLDATWAYVADYEGQRYPSYQCYNCWTIVFPDGRVLSKEELAALEAKRIAGVEKDRVPKLMETYGWDKAKAERVLGGSIMYGDEGAAVREAWGRPLSIETTMLPKGGRREKWLYEGGDYVELKDGVVTSVHE